MLHCTLNKILIRVELGLKKTALLFIFLKKLG